ncbi:MAG TPA: enoyl-CoA hydratase/isomerase family protein [Microscillaceae bacterium]|nr:enoyl-CoA hydratase/isomerase family protein [Microscillaceae bacterium]
MTYKHWLVSLENHVLRLTINNPEKKNRLHQELFLEFRDIITYIKQTSEVWVVVIEGAAGHFSSGVDVSLIGTMIGKNEEAYRQDLQELQYIFDEFEALEKPTIAKIDGYCLGGGVILALCCDFRIATETSIFGLPEVKRSIGVIMGTQRITRVAGIAAAKEMILLGDNFDAAQAKTYGLINRVVAPETLEQAVTALAQKFLKLPPLAVGVCKRIIQEGQFAERNGQNLEIAAQHDILHTQDFQEAIKSFFEKREPKYEGK